MDEFHRGFNEGMTKGAAITEQDKADAERWRKLVQKVDKCKRITLTVETDGYGAFTPHPWHTKRYGKTLADAIDSIRE